MDHVTDSNTNRSYSICCVEEQVLNSTRDGLVDGQFKHRVSSKKEFVNPKKFALHTCGVGTAE